MKAFKFRSEDQFAYALDIIFNQRLRCSDWSKLNDPVEGSFYTTTDRGVDRARIVDRIISQKKKIKVCALSKTFNSHLLWAHYASGFSGVAIEVEIPEPDASLDNLDLPKVREITYGGVFGPLHIGNHFDPNLAAEVVLSRKYQEWSTEQEIRILNDGPWFELDAPVSCVIAGHRMNKALFTGLQIICDRQNIPLCTTGIGNEGIDADHVATPPAGAVRLAAARQQEGHYRH